MDMKILIVSILMTLCLALDVHGQPAANDKKPVTPAADSINVWTPTLATGLNISQIAFSNWTQGGTDALAWTATVDGSYDYKGKIWKLQNHLRASYGRSQLGGAAAITTDNNLLIENVLTYNLGWATNPFVSNTIITTLAEGYSYATSVPVPIANFFDPGYVTQSIGFAYSNSNNFTTRLGVATQEIFANKFRQYTDNPNTPNKLEAFKLETGFESVSRAKLHVANNMLLTTGLRLFTRFSNLTVWDVRWDNLIVAKVNSIINVNFTYELVYQKDQSPRTQMKEGLQLGVTYSIF